jgi:hypothetical protein
MQPTTRAKFHIENARFGYAIGIAAKSKCDNGEERHQGASWKTGHYAPPIFGFSVSNDVIGWASKSASAR